MSPLTPNQQIVKQLIDYHVSERWLDKVEQHRLRGLYLTLKALGVSTEVKIGEFPCFMKSHNKAYVFSNGALLVDGLLMDLSGCEGEKEIENRLKATVANNADLVWEGPIAWSPLLGISFEVYKPMNHNDPTVSQFEDIIEVGVAHVQAWTLRESAPASKANRIHAGTVRL